MSEGTEGRNRGSDSAAAEKANRGEFRALIDRLERVARTRGEPDLRAKGTYVQRAGFWLACMVFGLIVVVTFCLLGYWLSANAELQHVERLFDIIVLKALVPIFTLILGYIFGSREGRVERSET